MSVAEMKIEVINKVTNLNNEPLLKEVLSLLKNTNETGNPSYNLSGAYESIKEQYEEVLQKLAQ